MTKRHEPKRQAPRQPRETLSLYCRASTFADKRTKRDRSRSQRERNAIRQAIKES